MNRQPRVAIIILNWNGIEDTKACLNSLKKISYKNYDVVLLDNGSRYKEPEFLQKEFGSYIDLFIKKKENCGFSGGNNIAIRRALCQDYDYFLLLNNDTEVAPDFLDELVNFAEREKKTGIVGPKIYFHSDKNRIWFAGGKMHWWTSLNYHIGEREMDKGQHDEPKKIDYTTGCTLLIKRKVIEQIGLLDEKFFAYQEDGDWCLRARKRGWQVWYVPTSKIWHKISASAGKNSPFQVHLVTRNRIWLVRKNHDLIKFHIMIFIFVFYKIPIKIFNLFLLKKQGSLFKPYLKGFFEGMRYRKNYLKK